MSQVRYRDSCLPIELVQLILEYSFSSSPDTRNSLLLACSQVNYTSRRVAEAELYSRPVLRSANGARSFLKAVSGRNKGRRERVRTLRVSGWWEAAGDYALVDLVGACKGLVKLELLGLHEVVLSEILSPKGESSARCRCSALEERQLTPSEAGLTTLYLCDCTLAVPLSRARPRPSSVTRLSLSDCHLSTSTLLPSLFPLLTSLYMYGVNPCCIYGRNPVHSHSLEAEGGADTLRGSQAFLVAVGPQLRMLAFDTDRIFSYPSFPALILLDFFRHSFLDYVLEDLVRPPRFLRFSARTHLHQEQEPSGLESIVRVMEGGYVRLYHADKVPPRFLSLCAERKVEVEIEREKDRGCSSFWEFVELAEERLERETTRLVSWRGVGVRERRGADGAPSSNAGYLKRRRSVAGGGWNEGTLGSRVA